ncbi:MAG: hypothetical protein FWB93_02745 [Oscillospiraceae bacterium]|nr:hypothetical protein [Oscillospiraceae bacterium]
MKKFTYMFFVIILVFLVSCTSDLNGGSYNDPPVDSNENEVPPNNDITTDNDENDKRDETILELQEKVLTLQSSILQKEERIVLFEQQIGEALWENHNERFIRHLLKNAYRLHPNGITLPLIEEFVLDEEMSRQFYRNREFRHIFSLTSGNVSELVEDQDYLYNWRLSVSTYPIVEPDIPTALSLIKHFDLAFETVREVEFLIYMLSTTFAYFPNNETFSNNETRESHNPYLLFTFNTERILDFYSIDPARHASARAWLIEWLAENEPYASYSAFRAAHGLG